MFQRRRSVPKRSPRLQPLPLPDGGGAACMSLGRARLELGPLLSSSTLETIAETRRRSSNDTYGRWLDAKRESPVPGVYSHSTGSDPSLALGPPDDLRRRRALSLDAYNKWCVQKDTERLEHLMLQEQHRARRRDAKQRAVQENLEEEARLLGETQGELRRATNQALRQDLALHGLEGIVPEESEEVAIAVLDLHMAISAAVSGSPTGRPAHPPVAVCTQDPLQ
eukprot:m.256573 g.256573  ORF g.256573 m.256573 type:complete len:224 (-) comp20219_c0_seq1:208-879(-)